MTGRKNKPQGPRARSPDAETRQGRQANKLGAGAKSKRAAAPTRKAETEQKSRKSAARAQAAAPLLAQTLKKVGAVNKSPKPGKPSAGANYQPKTQPPPTPVGTHAAAPHAAVDVLSLAQPWMTLGWRMTAAGLALHARMAKAAFEMPPPATALRQGAEAMNAWFELMQMRPSKPRKKDRSDPA